MLLARERFDEVLRQHGAGGRGEEDFRPFAADGTQRPFQHFGHEGHAAFAAEAVIVDLTVIALRKVAQIDDRHADQAFFHGPSHDAGAREAVEKLGERGDDGDFHSSHNPSIRWMATRRAFRSASRKNSGTAGIK